MGDYLIMNKTITFIGAGNMAEALVKGLISKSVCNPTNIVVTDMGHPRRASSFRRATSERKKPEKT